MKFLKCSLVALGMVAVMTGPAAAALRVSAQSGPWSSPATWTGGDIPAAGDNVSIGHAVTLSTNASLLGSPALSISAGGSLTLQPGAAVILAGGAYIQGGGALNILSGGEIGLQNGSQIFISGEGTGGRLSAAGTPGQRARIRSLDGSAAGIAGEPGASVSLRHTDTVGLRIAIAAGMNSDIQNASIWSSGSFSAVVDDTASFVLANSSFKQTQSSSALLITVPVLEAAPSGSQQRVIQGNYFDSRVRFNGTGDLSITDNVFAEAFSVEGDHGRGWSKFERNLIRNPNREELILTGHSLNNIWITDGQHENPHFIQALTWRNTSIDGDIFHFTGSDDNGDAIGIYDFGIPTTITIRRVLVLPNGAGKNSGTLFSALAGPRVTIVAEHNTYLAGTQGAAVGETYSGHRGMVESFRSNIAWDTSANGYKLYDSGPDDTVFDLVKAPAADYNCGFNLLSGTNGFGYSQLEFSQGLPGLHDRDEDPLFFAPYRNIFTWDASLGGAGTMASVLSALSTINDDNPAPGYSIVNLLSYIRTGFSPHNPSLKGAAHDGGDIGAVPFGATDASPVPTPTLAPPPTATSVPTFTASPGEPGEPTPPGDPTSPAGDAPSVVQVPGATPTLTAGSSFGISVRIKGRKASLQWKYRAKQYKIVVLRNGRLVARRITVKREIVLSRLRRGIYTVRCGQYPPVSKPAIEAQVQFKIH